MNKKVLGLLAASAAVLGSAIFATPARAVKQDVQVDLTVDEVLFLRTFERVELRVTQGELSGDTSQETEAVGTTDGTALIDTTAPVLGTESTATSITKSVQELYAVYGNSTLAPTVTIKVNPTGQDLTNGFTEGDRDFRKAVMSVDSEQGTISGRDFSELRDQPLQVGGVDLTFNFEDDRGTPAAPIAGTYTGGILTVEATAVGAF
ncbi:MAG: hypothetical protein SWZ49_23410 [Cyanobacteriota bacterium]|nr:hypothetical protein [Cyanobacteriota bacterium]